MKKAQTVWEALEKAKEAVRDTIRVHEESQRLLTDAQSHRKQLGKEWAVTLMSEKYDVQVGDVYLFPGTNGPDVLLPIVDIELDSKDAIRIRGNGHTSIIWLDFEEFRLYRKTRGANSPEPSPLSDRVSALEVER